MNPCKKDNCNVSRIGEELADAYLFCGNCRNDRFFVRLGAGISCGSCAGNNVTEGCIEHGAVHEMDGMIKTLPCGKVVNVSTKRLY